MGRSYLVLPISLLPIESIEYLFRHALVQDAAYESLLRQDRRRLHLDVAEAIRDQFPDRELDLAATLAHHFVAANDRERALYYLSIAAEQALARHAHPEAETLYRSALERATAEADRRTLLTGLAESVVMQSRFDEAI